MAVRQLGAFLSNLRQSSSFDTAPVGVGAQPRYLIGVVVGDTDLPARELLDRLMEVERQDGRMRPGPGAARTLDLDLIFYGDQRVAEPGLVVPHPRFRERLFVLEPLAELVPDWIDPVSGEKVSALLAWAKRRPS